MSIRASFLKLSLLCLTPLMMVLLVNLPRGFTLNPFEHIREQNRQEVCVGNLKQLGFGIAAYCQDNDRRLPPTVVEGAKGNPPPSSITCLPSPVTVGWADTLESYTKSTSILTCISDIHGPVCDSRAPGFTDYWINGNAAGMRIPEIRRQSSTLLVGDGDGGSPPSNATYSMRALPANWASLPDTDEPPWFYRHAGGANYLFVDGHAKWLRPGQVSNETGKLHTFSIR